MTYATPVFLSGTYGALRHRTADISVIFFAESNHSFPTSFRPDKRNRATTPQLQNYTDFTCTSKCNAEIPLRLFPVGGVCRRTRNGRRSNRPQYIGQFVEVSCFYFGKQGLFYGHYRTFSRCTSLSKSNHKKTGSNRLFLFCAVEGKKTYRGFRLFT